MATLLFNDDGTVQFYYGCNAGGGQYTVNGDSFIFEQVVSTQMACAGDKGDVEAAVIRRSQRRRPRLLDRPHDADPAGGHHGLQYDAAVDVSN